MKRFFEILAHILFWILAGYLFLKYSFIRPSIGLKLEFLSAFMIAATIYFNYFVLYPFLFLKNKRVLYIVCSLLSVLLIAVVESLITTPIVYDTLFLKAELMRAYIQSIYFFIFLRDFGFLVFFIIFKFYMEALKVNRLEKEKFEIETNYLRSRIAPHFLYNVLNSIYADSIVKDERLPEYIFQLSKLLHYYVDESHRDQVSLTDEINFYKRYIELENKRYDHKIEVTFSTNIEDQNCNIAPLLFEPLISNAFKYVHKDGTGKIQISLQGLHKKEVHFSCTNTKWNDTSHVIDTTSKGLCTLKSRLQLLYPGKHELVIDNTDNTYCATLIVKLD